MYNKSNTLLKIDDNFLTNLNYLIIAIFQKLKHGFSQGWAKFREARLTREKTELSEKIIIWGKFALTLTMY